MEKLSVKNKKYEEYLKFLKNNPQSSTNRAGWWSNNNKYGE